MFKLFIFIVSVSLNNIQEVKSLTIPQTPPSPQCQRDGKSYPEGYHLKVSPCEFCDCYSGRFACVIADCFIIECVDSIRDPNRCCPVCPNGKKNTDAAGHCTVPQ